MNKSGNVISGSLSFFVGQTPQAKITFLKNHSFSFWRKKKKKCDAAAVCRCTSSVSHCCCAVVPFTSFIIINQTTSFIFSKTLKLPLTFSYHINCFLNWTINKHTSPPLPPKKKTESLPFLASIFFTSTFTILHTHTPYIHTEIDKMAAPPPPSAPGSLPYNYLFKVLIIGDASVGKVR